MANQDTPGSQPTSSAAAQQSDELASAQPAAGPRPDAARDDDVVAHWVEDGDDPPWCIGAVSIR
jgi:hypothetical protein